MPEKQNQKHMTFEEYKKEWAKDPAGMQKKINETKKSAEGLMKSVKQLKRQGKKKLADELEAYCEASLNVSKPPIEFLSQKEQKAWEKDQEKLAGLGQFTKENRVDLKLAMIAADEEDEYQEDKDDVDQKPPEEEQRREYEGFQDFLRMLIEAICDAFKCNYPELEYERRQKHQIDRERRKHERELLKAEMQKEKELQEKEAEYEKNKNHSEGNTGNDDTPKDPNKEEDKHEAYLNEKEKEWKNMGMKEPFDREKFKKNLKEYEKDLEQKTKEVEEAEKKHQDALEKAENLHMDEKISKPKEVDNQTLNSFLDKASKNGWNTSPNGDRDFLETVFKTPGLENMISKIQQHKLHPTMPAADKLAYAQEMQAAVRNDNYSPQMKNEVSKIAEKQKINSLSSLEVQYNNSEHTKTSQQTKEFLDKAQKNGWNADSVDKEFLTRFYQLPGLDAVTKLIETKPLSKDNPDADKEKFAFVAKTAIQQDAVKSNNKEADEQYFSNMQNSFSEKAKNTVINQTIQKKDAMHTLDFLGKAAKNGWDALGSDRDFLMRAYMTAGQETLLKYIEDTPLQPETISSAKSAIAGQMNTNLQNGSVLGLWDDRDPQKAIQENNLYRASLAPKITEENNKQAEQMKQPVKPDEPKKEEKKEELKQPAEKPEPKPEEKKAEVKQPVKEEPKREEKKAEANQPVKEEPKQEAKPKAPEQEKEKPAFLNPKTYTDNIDKLNEKNNAEHHSTKLKENAAALIILMSIEKENQKNKQADQPKHELTEKQMNENIQKMMKDPYFDDVMQKYGDLNKPENAKKLQADIKEKDGQTLYGNWMQTGLHTRQRDRRYSEVKKNYQKKQKEQELNNEKKLTNNKNKRRESFAGLN